MAIGVTVIRRFELTQTELSVHALGGAWFVYDRDLGAMNPKWHLRCGPYASFDQARDWIFAIQETDL